MGHHVRLAVIGVGNNTSALVQGIALHRATGRLVGVRRPEIDGIGVGDVDIVAAFAISDGKVGTDLHHAIFAEPNNYPRLDVELPATGVVVQRGLTGAEGTERIAEALTGADVVLYSAPSGRPDTARAYAEAALLAGAAFVNTTSDAVARDQAILARYERAGVPLLGDDLASQFGASVVHRALLEVLEDRGLALVSSYQVNLGGTEDFRNLVEHPNTKKQSKLNALGTDKVQMAPLGYLPHLGAQKVTHINVEARGWGETEVSLDLRLKVYDPSGAAGVNIDLVRLAASAHRAGTGGYLDAASAYLKSRPGTAV